MGWVILSVPQRDRTAVMNTLIHLQLVTPVGFQVFGLRRGDDDVRLFLSPAAAKNVRKISLLSSLIEGIVENLPEGCVPVLGEHSPVG